MTTGIRRFVLRFIVGLMAFLLGVAASMAFAGFRPFDNNQSVQPQQQNYRHYQRKRSCNFEFRKVENVPLTPPPAPSVGSQSGTIYLKETRVIVED